MKAWVKTAAQHIVDSADAEDEDAKKESRNRFWRNFLVTGGALAAGGVGAYYAHKNWDGIRQGIADMVGEGAGKAESEKQLQAARDKELKRIHKIDDETAKPGFLRAAGRNIVQGAESLGGSTSEAQDLMAGAATGTAGALLAERHGSGARNVAEALGRRLTGIREKWPTAKSFNWMGIVGAVRHPVQAYKALQAPVVDRDVAKPSVIRVRGPVEAENAARAMASGNIPVPGGGKVDTNAVTTAKAVDHPWLTSANNAAKVIAAEQADEAAHKAATTAHSEAHAAADAADARAKALRSGGALPEEVAKAEAEAAAAKANVVARTPTPGVASNATNAAKLELKKSLDTAHTYNIRPGGWKLRTGMGVAGALGGYLASKALAADPGHRTIDWAMGRTNNPAYEIQK